MKENCEHYIETLVYLMEHAVAYTREKGNQVFKELNMEITLDQLTILDTVSLFPGICQMDLAKLILRERSYTSRILDYLEKSGFIKRKINRKNKRLVNELYITPKGQDIMFQSRKRLEGVTDRVFEDISEEEYKVIRNGILKMRECVSKFTVIQV